MDTGSDRMRKIAIICAFYEEVAYFIQKYHLQAEDDIYTFEIGSNEILLVKTGVGKVNAACHIQKVIDIFNPDYIMNSGCSGALTKDIPLYGIVLSDVVFYHDFYPMEIMKKYMPGEGRIAADAYLIEKAKEACKKLDIEEVIVGSVATGDCYVTEEGKVQEIVELGAKTVDMESAAIGHVCALNKVPFLCIRSISDFADGNEVDEIESSKKAARITEKLIQLL